MKDGRAQILVVEDNASDVRLLREALREARTPNDLVVAGDGERALALLRSEGCDEERPLIDLVLLDLNLPRKGGLEVLADMRREPALRLVPVIVLTTSTAHADVLAAYEAGANSFVVKPVDFDHFRTVVAAIDEFWLSVAVLPGPVRGASQS